MVDFALLPPEINSALMYAGPGAGPMTAASVAWETLGGELQSAAARWATMLTGLTDEPWQGPSAAAMAEAVIPQISWLRDTGALAQQAGAQAAAAVSAYETAFAGTVPPAAIAANRALLAALLATNFFGINAVAIAATEAQYVEFWAQDAGAMYGYAGAAGEAAALPPFTPQGIAAALHQLGQQVNATFTAVHTSIGQQGFYDIPRALFRLAGVTNENPGFTNPQALLGLTGTTFNSNGDGIILNGVIGDIAEGLTGSQTIDASTPMDAYIRLISPFRLTTTALKDLDGLAHSAFPELGKVAEGAAKAAEGAATKVSTFGSGFGSNLGGVVGSAASAAKVGGLSVPVSWVGTGPAAASPITVALNGMGAVAAAEPAATAFGGLPMMPGAGAGRTVSNFAAPRYGFKPLVVSTPPSAG